MATWNRYSFDAVRDRVREALAAEPLPDRWRTYMHWTDASRSGFGQGQNRGSFGQVEVRHVGRQHISRRVGGRIHGGEERESGKGWAEREAANLVVAIRAEAVAGAVAHQDLLKRLKESLPNRNMLRTALNVKAAELELHRWAVATGDNNTNADVRRALHDARVSLNKAIEALDKLETAADG